MKRSIFTFAIAISGMLFMPSCNETGGGSDDSSTEMEHTDVVESGTYTGTAIKVDDEEKEIYVETEDGKTLELYFTDQTQLNRNGQQVAFEDLNKNDRVRVKIEKKGKRLEPMEVEIME